MPVVDLKPFHDQPLRLCYFRKHMTVLAGKAGSAVSVRPTHIAKEFYMKYAVPKTGTAGAL